MFSLQQSSLIRRLSRCLRCLLQPLRYAERVATFVSPADAAGAPSIRHLASGVSLEMVKLVIRCLGDALHKGRDSARLSPFLLLSAAKLAREERCESVGPTYCFSSCHVPSFGLKIDESLSCESDQLNRSVPMPSSLFDTALLIGLLLVFTKAADLFLLERQKQWLNKKTQALEKWLKPLSARRVFSLVASKPIMAIQALPIIVLLGLYVWENYFHSFGCSQRNYFLRLAGVRSYQRGSRLE